MRRKYSESNGLKIIVINKLSVFLESTRYRPAINLNFNPTSGRCFKCLEAIVGKKSCKAEKEKLNNKLKTKCSKCQVFTYKAPNRTAIYCEDCIE